MIKRILETGLPVPGFIKPVFRLLYRGGVAAHEGLVLLRKILFVEPVLRSIVEGAGPALRVDRLPYIRGKGRLRLGAHVNLSGQSCFYFMRSLQDPSSYAAGKGLPALPSREPGRAGSPLPAVSGALQEPLMSRMPERPLIEIGDHTFIGNGCTLSAARSIRVGNHVLISAGVRIHDNDGHPLDAARRHAGERIRADEASPVRIEDGSWIGGQAIILKGVTIGKDAVVGAGAVVTHDVAPGTVVAGNPAREIGGAGELNIEE